MYHTLRVALGQPVPDGGTVAVNYPAGKAAYHFASSGHSLSVSGNTYNNPALSFGASNITITNNTGYTWTPTATVALTVAEKDAVKIVSLTQAQYEAIATPDENTLYVIVG